MTFLDNECREIITKAVCGSGEKQTKVTKQIIPREQPSSILGCWIINHSYHAEKQSTDVVEVSGSYDINVWYAFNNNTQTEVVLETVHYRDEIELSSRDASSLHDDEVIAKVAKQPNCLQCQLTATHGEIEVEVEKAFTVKVIGETRINVKVERHVAEQPNELAERRVKAISRGEFPKAVGK